MIRFISIFILLSGFSLNADAAWIRASEFFSIPRSENEIIGYLRVSAEHLRQTDSLTSLELSKIYAWAFESSKNDLAQMIRMILLARNEESFEVSSEAQEFQDEISKLIYEIYLLNIFENIKSEEDAVAVAAAVVGYDLVDLERLVEGLQYGEGELRRYWMNEFHSAKRNLVRAEIFSASQKYLRYLRLLIAVRGITLRRYVGISPRQLEKIMPIILGSEYSRITEIDLEFLRDLAIQHASLGRYWRAVDVKVGNNFGLYIAFKTKTRPSPLAAVVLTSCELMLRLAGQTSFKK